MKNFRRNFKKFRKNFHKYFCEDIVIDVRLGYLIEIVATALITALITASITQAVTIENRKNAQVDALMIFYHEYMDACHEVNNSECHWEFDIRNGVVTDINVADDYGYDFNHYLTEL